MLITLLIHLPNKTLVTLDDVDIDQSVRSVETRLLALLNDENVSGCVLKAIGNTWSSIQVDDENLLMKTLLKLDPAILRLSSLTPSKEPATKLGYQSDASYARRTCRVIRWISTLPITKKQSTTPIINETKPSVKGKRRGSIDPSDPDFQKQPNRRRSRESIIYMGADPSAMEANEEVATLTTPSSQHAGVRYLVGVDGSEISHMAYLAVRSLMTRQGGDKIEVLHICDRSKTYLPFDLEPDYVRNQYEVALIDIQASQKNITILNKPNDDDPVGYALNRIGTKALVCKYAQDTTYPDGIDGVPTHDSPDILVVGMVGRKGPKLNPHVLGSAADYSMRSVTCACLIIKSVIPGRGNSNLKPRNFVVAVDGSSAAHQAFLDSIRICDRNRDNVICVIFHDTRQAIVNNRVQDPNDIAEEYRRLLRDAGVTRGSSLAVEKTLGASYGENICSFAWDNDAHVLFVGADGMKKYLNGEEQQPGANRFGSVSDYCICHCKCNIMVSKNK